MNHIREKAQELRSRYERGDLLSMSDVQSASVTLEDALTIFTGPADEDDNGIFPNCCGERCEVSGGLFGGRATCKLCGAEARDLLAPMDSPILERGNSHVTTPGKELIDLLGARHWFVTHEGNRP